MYIKKNNFKFFFCHFGEISDFSAIPFLIIAWSSTLFQNRFFLPILSGTRCSEVVSTRKKPIWAENVIFPKALENLLYEIKLRKILLILKKCSKSTTKISPWKESRDYWPGELGLGPFRKFNLLFYSVYLMK